MMRSDAWRAVQSTLSPPVQNASFKDHRTVAFTKSIVPIEIEQYVEFDDSYRLFSPVLNANRYPTLKKRRRSVYIPNTLWTRSLAIIVIFKTILTVAIERLEIPCPQIFLREVRCADNSSQLDFY